MRILLWRAVALNDQAEFYFITISWATVGFEDLELSCCSGPWEIDECLSLGMRPRGLPPGVHVGPLVVRGILTFLCP